jgi:hypothetical protein
MQDRTNCPKLEVTTLPLKITQGNFIAIDFRHGEFRSRISGASGPEFLPM